MRVVSLPSAPDNSSVWKGRTLTVSVIGYPRTYPTRPRGGGNRGAAGLRGRPSEPPPLSDPPVTRHASAPRSGATSGVAEPLRVGGSGGRPGSHERGSKRERSRGSRTGCVGLPPRRRIAAGAGVARGPGTGLTGGPEAKRERGP